MEQDRIERAKQLVREHVRERTDKSDPPVEFDVRVVWFCYILGGWKALVSTTLPDGKYYEVTHNRNNGETYLDVYLKLYNQRVVNTSELF